MAAQLARINLGFEYPRVQHFPAVRPSAAHGFPSIGARGCFLSHLEILRLAEREAFTRILILEDDVDFAPDFSRRIDGVVEALSVRRWSVFYGGYDVDSVPAQVGEVREIAWDRPIRTTHFLAVQAPAIGQIRRLLETLLSRAPGDARGGPMHVDGAYNWFRRLHREATTLLCVPQLGKQRSSRTDVHPLRWYDTTPIARDAVAGLRRLKNAIHSRVD